MRLPSWFRVCGLGFRDHQQARTKARPLSEHAKYQRNGHGCGGGGSRRPARYGVAGRVRHEGNLGLGFSSSGGPKPFSENPSTPLCSNIETSWTPAGARGRAAAGKRRGC